MTDEDKKRIVSEPPPPTDEIDGEWGEDDQTLVRELPESVLKSQPTPPTADEVAKTAVAPISVPAPAVSAKAEAASAKVDAEDDDETTEDEDEDDETTEDEDDETTEDETTEDEDDDEHEASAAPNRASASPAADWIPEWAPFAVLGLLVTASIVFGLGLVGGGEEPAEEGEAAPAASALAPAKKPSSHP
jgi:archaellum component FlaD/FlaE